MSDVNAGASPTDVPAFDWHMPVQVRFGRGCSDGIADALGRRPVCVLAFEPAERLGLRAAWQAAFGDRLVAWVTVPDGLSTLALARTLAVRVWPALESRDDAVLLALGGGSVLDLAKLLRVVPSAPAASEDLAFDAVAAVLRGQAGWPAHRRAPLWLVPTTAGTGSEVTRWATLWDTDHGQRTKRSFDEPWGHADRAFVDAALGATAPPAVTRDAALDALGHALEALWNRHANPASDALAVQAARRVLRHLPLVLRTPGLASAREQLALAALEAGLAFAQTRTALAHALSYALTLDNGVPHGLAVAVWLPAVWDLAVGHDARADARLAEVFDVPAHQGAARLRAWLGRLGVPCSAADVGVGDVQARVAAALASVRGRNFVGAPARAEAA